MTPNRFFQLPLTFDPDQLLADLQICLSQDWTSHFNTSCYSGNWNSISLRSATGDPSDIHTASAPAGFADTSLLAPCTYFREILDGFRCGKESARLLRLTPGSFIHEHRDLGIHYIAGYFRIHIPILTDDGVQFVVDGSELSMKAGECWYADFNLPHSVAHHGKSDRIHLIIDCLRNEWSDALFKEAGYDFEHEINLREPDKATKKQMLDQFAKMPGETARMLFEKLSRELANES
jgi:hypothetical protein